MFDPRNIRYATDSTNMQLWNTHNPFRACLVCADGHMVLWDYKNAPFLSEFNDLVKERLSGASMFYFSVGDGIDENADAFSAQVTEIMRAHAGSNTRLAVDKIMLRGAKALEARGFELMDGEVVTDKARAIKGPDEIKAMRCASQACEDACYAMEAFAREEIPNGNVSEDDVWLSYMQRTSSAAENGSKRGCWHLALAPTRGSRKRRTESSRMAICWPSIRT